MISLNRAGRLSLALAVAATITGCATTNNPKDPYESFNRSMFSFNDSLDRVALKPAATVYREILPSFLQTGVGNFFGNIGDVWTAVNNLIQGKLGDGMSDVARVVLNSTAGLLGVIDVASEAGLPKHREDFGQTLGKWGGEPGPYVVLPFFGPSTVRDTFALPVDFIADPWKYKHPVDVRNIGRGLRVLDRRAGALDAVDLVEEAALDKYEFVRDAYLQRRESEISDYGDKSIPVYENNDAALKPERGGKRASASSSSGKR